MSINKSEIFERIRSESDFFQKAKLIYYLRKNQELTLKEIADGIGLQSSHASHILRLLKLPDIIIDGYYSKVVSITHLFILSRLKTQAEMMETYETILAKSLTVPQTEELIREKLYDISSDSKDKLSEKEIKEFTELIHSVNPDIKVKIVQTRILGKILIEIKGDRELTTKELKKIIERMVRNDLKVENKKEKIYPLE